MKARLRNEQIYSQTTLQAVGRNLLIREQVKKIIDEIPMHSLKKMFNVEEINEMSCQEKMKNSTTQEECNYWSNRLTNCLRTNSETISLTIEIETNEQS